MCKLSGGYVDYYQCISQIESPEYERGLRREAFDNVIGSNALGIATISYQGCYPPPNKPPHAFGPLVALLGTPGPFVASTRTGSFIHS